MMLRPILTAAATAALAASGAAAQENSGRPYTVTMTGAAERPGPGDPDGTGTATLRVNPGQRQVCYTLTVSNIDAASAAHVHRGGPNEAGPPVITLDAPATGSSSGCATVARALAQELIRTPAAFYVNVHNAAFPAGAVRGQLGR